MDEIQNSIQVKPDTKMKQSSMQKKLIIFSAILFLSIFSLGGLTFWFQMERNLITNEGNQLVRDIETEQVRLEASVNSEVAIVLQMANSPVIKRYFQNPTDPELEQMAFEAFDAYEKSFASQIVFWINDIDMMFYFSGGEPYWVDPFDPVNYWYFMTIYETDVYNFNINYNPEMDMMNLWINAPVFDETGAPIGMVGGAINLSEFIETLYSRFDYNNNSDLYLFNAFNEITGTTEMDYIESKITIDEKLGALGIEILAQKNHINPGETIFFTSSDINGVVVLGSIPVLDWYITAVHPFGMFDSLRNTMTLLFTAMWVILLVIIVIFNLFATKLLRESEQAKKRVEEANATITEGINYAGKIQTNLLPPDSVFKDAFSDFSVIWEPRDIVGGDIYWAKNFENGTVLCVCDCTGHGTPGALLTMLVVSAFEATITETRCHDTAEILYMLDQKLAKTLNVEAAGKDNNDITIINDGCDLAVLFISKNGEITMSAGNTDLYVCDGSEVIRYKGQKIFIGEGKIESKDDIKTVSIPSNASNKYYIASDGLYDQIGDNKKQFGTRIFKQIILENHNEDHADISTKIRDAFEEHRGRQDRRDDVELITFTLK